MNLRSWEFEQLQPHEFLELLEGYQWRKQENENTLAYFTHWVVNAFVTKPISPADILRPLRENPQEKKKTVRAELMEKFKGVL